MPPLEVPPASSPGRRRNMQANRARDTAPEVAVRSALHRAGLRFRKHARPLASLHCEADVVFRRERVAVFIDGCYWHGCSEHARVPDTNNEYWSAKIGGNIARDERNNAALAEAGWLVIRHWEHEPVEDVVASVRAALSNRRTSGPSPDA